MKVAPMYRDSEQLRRSLLFALIVTTVTVVVLKVLTGLALAPLAILACGIFVIAFTLRLRIERTGVQARMR